MKWRFVFVADIIQSEKSRKYNFIPADFGGITREINDTDWDALLKNKEIT